MTAAAAGTLGAGRGWHAWTADGRLALAVALVCGIAYSWLVSGVDTGLFSDTGRWHHEVERFAQGEIPYRDFYWYFPPASLWLVGGVARLTGTGLVPVQVTTTAVFLGIIVATWRLVRITVAADTLAVLLVALVLACAYAGSLGAPLPLGYYIPAGPVGLLALLGATVILTPWRGAPGPVALTAGGALLGCAVISKQDFWLPVLLLGAVTLFAVLRGRDRPVRAAVILALAAIAPVVVGVAYVETRAGATPLSRIVGGLGVAQSLRGRAYPTWERLAIETCTASTLLATLAGCFWLAGHVRRAARITAAFAVLAAASGTLVVIMTMRTATSGARAFLRYHVEAGAPLLRPAFGYLRAQGLYHGLPLLLSAGLLLFVLLRWRRWTTPVLRDQVTILLGLWVTARLRRGFEVTEWFEPLLAVPALLALVRLLAEGTPAAAYADRIGRALLALLLVVGGASYWQLQRGPFSRRPCVRTVTARGTACWPAAAAADYALLRDALARLDPSGRRPVFAAGMAGAINYYVGRRNPTPFTHDFYHSNGDPDTLLAAIPARVPDLILVDYRAVNAVDPSPRLDFRHWAPASVASFRITYNTPRFARLAADCVAVPWPAGTRTALVLYDCGRPRPASPPPAPGE